MGYRIHRYTNKGEHFWTLFSANGRKIAGSGDGYKKVADMDKMLNRIFPWFRPKKNHCKDSGSGADPRIDQLIALVKTGNQQGVQIMSKADDINAKLDAIDTTTNEIAADIDNLLAGGLEGLTKEQADAVVARLTTLSDTLKGVAAKS
jgi:hypothetical protein